MSEPTPNPDLIAYRKFATKLADACLVAINEHGVIITEEVAPWGKCACPLGCLPEFQPRGGYPGNHEAARVLGIEYRTMLAFTRGFDGLAFADANDNGFGPKGDAYPYYRLGQAYRRKFVEKET